MQLREEQEVENEAWRLEFESEMPREGKQARASSSSSGSEEESEPNEEEDDEMYSRALGLQDNMQEAIAFRESMKEV